MLKLITKLPQYYLARNYQNGHPLPINLTMGLTYRCNSKCLTCRIYDKPKVDELKIDEWKKILENIGDSLYWVTFSGGEPFLFQDIVELYYWVNQYSKPSMINIPTNGQLTKQIVDKVWQMSKMFSQTKLTINLSLDHCQPDYNNEIRGIEGYYDRAKETLDELLKIESDNLTIGIHSVISKFNVKDIKPIVDTLPLLLKDQTHYITEIAENRIELGTVGLDITPNYDDYKKAIEYLKKFLHSQPNTLIRAFRLDYYDKVLKWYSEKHIPCYAGYASCQITPDGDVVPCCVRYESMGNLRANNYDFKKIWCSSQADFIRLGVKECNGCPLANVSYTNSLLHVPTMINVARRLIA